MASGRWGGRGRGGVKSRWRRMGWGWAQQQRPSDLIDVFIVKSILTVLYSILERIFSHFSS